MEDKVNKIILSSIFIIGILSGITLFILNKVHYALEGAVMGLAIGLFVVIIISIWGDC